MNLIRSIALALVLLVVFGVMGRVVELEAQPTFDAGRVTVAATATPIFVVPPRGASVRICNRHTTPIFIGPVGVTIANGFEIINATCEDVKAYPRTTIYGIVAAATARVDYFGEDYPR